jgi:hypothetical protein
MPANKTASKNMGVRLDTSSSPLIENLVRAMALNHNDNVRARFSIFVWRFGFCRPWAHQKHAGIGLSGT